MLWLTGFLTCLCLVLLIWLAWLVNEVACLKTRVMYCVDETAKIRSKVGY